MSSAEVLELHSAARGFTALRADTTVSWGGAAGRERHVPCGLRVVSTSNAFEAQSKAESKAFPMIF